jgi:Uma2 family endonuclease
MGSGTEKQGGFLPSGLPEALPAFSGVWDTLGGMETMADPVRQLNDRFTYGQYRVWPEDERWELIDGEAWMMASPSTWHQEIVTRLLTEIRIFLKGKPCLALPAPFDVLLPASEEADDEVPTVVQPDIAVFCDPAKLREKNARGAPDVVVEILSKSTKDKDEGAKFRLYERAGVREYWVIDPEELSIDVYPLVAVPGGRRRFGQREFRYPPKYWTRVGSTVLEGFSIDPGELFQPLA